MSLLLTNPRSATQAQTHFWSHLIFGVSDFECAVETGDDLSQTPTPTSPNLLIGQIELKLLRRGVNQIAVKFSAAGFVRPKGSPHSAVDFQLVNRIGT
jgi:hypothetical protein